MTLASGAAIAVGSRARARLPERTVRLVAADLFLLLGVLLLADVLRG